MNLAEKWNVPIFAHDFEASYLNGAKSSHHLTLLLGGARQDHCRRNASGRQTRSAPNTSADAAIWRRLIDGGKGALLLAFDLVWTREREYRVDGRSPDGLGQRRW